MARFRVLLYESMHPNGTALLEQSCELHYAQSLEPDYLIRAIRDMDAVIVRANGQLTRAMIEAAPKLKVIGRHGVGLDTIDLAAAADRGIPVVNTPEANDISVAEAFFALAFALAKQTVQGNQAARNGDWAFRSRSYTASLWGKTLGVYGFGKIGRMTARMGHSGFAMPVLYASTSKHSEAEQELGAVKVSPEELFARSDFISVNLPLSPATHHAVDATLISRMKPSAFVVNMARGQVWDEAAVAAALDDGRIAGAATDVFEQEPPAADNPLFSQDNFVCSPHNSSHTEEAMANMSMVAADVLAVLEGREPRYRVRV